MILKVVKMPHRICRNTAAKLWLIGVLNIAMAWCVCAPAKSADAVARASGLTEAQLTLLVKGAKTGLADFQVRNTGPLVNVFATANVKASEMELKIDAVFVAKALVEGAPGQVDIVHVMISQAGKERLVEVKRNQVEEYSSGRIKADQFLASIQFQGSDPPLPVEPGVEAKRRVKVLQDIQSLSKGGTGVAAFMDLFKKLEVSVKAGDAASGIAEQLAFLEAKLQDQREQIRQARKTARGLGVSAHASGASTPSSSSSSSSAPDPAAVPPGMPGGARNVGYIPPNHEQIESAFRRKSDSYISKMKTLKDPSAATKAIELKRLILSGLASGSKEKRSEAFGLIKQFQEMAATLLNEDLMRPDYGSSDGLAGGGPGGFGGPNDGGMSGDPRMSGGDPMGGPPGGEGPAGAGGFGGPEGGGGPGGGPGGRGGGGGGGRR